MTQGGPLTGSTLVEWWHLYSCGVVTEWLLTSMNLAEPLRSLHVAFLHGVLWASHSTVLVIQSECPMRPNQKNMALIVL